MSEEQISHLKAQLASLTRPEKLELARFLSDQARLDAAPSDSETTATNHSATVNKRAQHLAWLKAHREQYAGQYVALDGDHLAGSGTTMREAHEQAQRQGVAQPFLVHVSSEQDAPFGGW
ncbi:MAG: hypothetical protein JST85_30595 [Acidobacteria bacterium]|nr:hypothetical protein [Acidobacteriota bacterium]